MQLPLILFCFAKYCQLLLNCLISLALSIKSNQNQIASTSINFYHVKASHGCSLVNHGPHAVTLWKQSHLCSTPCYQNQAMPCKSNALGNVPIKLSAWYIHRISYADFLHSSRFTIGNNNHAHSLLNFHVVW